MNVEELQNLEKNLDFFLTHPDDLGRMPSAERRDVLQLASHTAVHCSKTELRNKSFDLLYNCCFLMDLDIKELWNIYWILNRLLFTAQGASLTGNMDELYKFIFSKILEGITDTYEQLKQPDSNLVIIITSQFLGVNHAPTRRVLDYSYAFATALHKNVMIINDSGLHFYPCSCLEQNFMLNFVDQYNNLTSVNYNGLEIPFKQIITHMPDIYSINEALHTIYEMQPELVYNIGGSSILADLCTLFTKTACFPCSTNIPVTMSRYLLVGRKTEERDRERLNRLEPCQEVLETVVNYQPAKSTREYKRSAFGLGRDEFVIGVVGNRLNQEIDNKFIDLISRILDENDVHFLFIGEIQYTHKIRFHKEKNKNLHFAGPLPEAAQAMKLFDIYCNPQRKGGGRSSFEALSHGIPVVTLKYGDVYYTCGPEFGVNTSDEYAARVKQCVSDPVYLTSLKKAALRRAEYLSDIPGTQKEILDKIL